MEWANDFSTVFRIQRVIPPSAFFWLCGIPQAPNPRFQLVVEAALPDRGAPVVVICSDQGIP